ncbi:MAG: DUF1461 domain-containing protein [Candidatus Woesearchaeota archaeon]
MAGIIMFRAFSIFILVFILVLGPLILVSNSLFTYSNQEEIRDFLFFGEDLEGFTINEVSHMEDVRFLLNLGSFFLTLSFIFVSLYFIFRGFDILKTSSLISFVLVFFVGIIGFFNFSFSFEVFHSIFFPQGNWMFPADSKLIELFPVNYFIEKSILVFFLTISLIFVVYLLSHYKSAR